MPQGGQTVGVGNAPYVQVLPNAADLVAKMAAFGGKYRLMLAPNYTYTLTSTLVIPAQGWLEGHGNNTVLKWGGADNTPMIQITGASTVLRGFKIDGNSKQTGVIGITPSGGNFSNHHWQHVFFSQIVTAFVQANGADIITDSLIEQCIWDSNTIGVSIGSADWLNFVGCLWTQNTKAFSLDVDYGFVNVIGGTFYGNGFDFYVNNNHPSVFCSHVWSEASTSGIFGAYGTNFTLRALEFHNCWLKSAGDIIDATHMTAGYPIKFSGAGQVGYLTAKNFINGTAPQGISMDEGWFVYLVDGAATVWRGGGYLTGAWGGAWASWPPVATPAALEQNGIWYIAYNSDATATRLYFYTNGAWKSVAVA